MHHRLASPVRVVEQRVALPQLDAARLAVGTAAARHDVSDEVLLCRGARGARRRSEPCQKESEEPKGVGGPGRSRKESDGVGRSQTSRKRWEESEGVCRSRKEGARRTCHPEARLGAILSVELDDVFAGARCRLEQYHLHPKESEGIESNQRESAIDKK